MSLQPALRTLTMDYNLLKRQVQDFPFMLDQAITQAKQEVRGRIQEAAPDSTSTTTKTLPFSLSVSSLSPSLRLRSVR